MRALCALELSNPESLSLAFEALYNGVWVEGKAVHKPEIYGPIFQKLLGEAAGKEVLENVCLTNCSYLLFRFFGLRYPAGLVE